MQFTRTGGKQLRKNLYGPALEVPWLTSQMMDCGLSNISQWVTDQSLNSMVVSLNIMLRLA